MRIRPSLPAPTAKRRSRGVRVEALDDRTAPAFLAPLAYPAGPTPTAVLAADFNDDDVLDLAVANPGTGRVSILLGSAGGAFGAPTEFVTGPGPVGLAVGDFDGDAVPDLATVNNSSVSVLIGDGTGGFAAPTTIDLEDGRQSVAVGDFNDDGTLDLGVVTSVYVFDGTGYYGNYFHYEGRADVLLGTGTGAFTRTTTTIGIGEYTGAAAADLNGDGRSDFVTAHPTSGTLSVQLADADGDLGPAAEFSAGSYPLTAAAGDVDGDGDLDLVMTHLYSQTVGVLIGDGQGAFGPGLLFGTGGGPAAAVLDDFDRDGRLDILTVNTFSTTVSVLLGRGDGTFSPAVTTAPSQALGGGAVGDFDGDTWPDVVTTHSVAGTAAVRLNDQAWPSADAPTVSINDTTLTEGNAGSKTATFTVSLEFASADPITVHFATSDGTATAADYTPTAGDVVFAPGETRKTFTVPVLGDRVPEPSETFAVTLTTADAFVGRGQGTGTIFDNEPTVFINNVTVREGNAGSKAAQFKVSLSFAYDQPVTVPYTTTADTAAAGSDFTARTGTVTIPAGQRSRTVTVPVLGDRLPEWNETFFLDLGAPTNAGIAEGRGVGTVCDNEPRISINSVAKREGDGASRTFVFTVRLSTAYNQAVTVNYTTSDGSATAGSDYRAQSGTLTFAPGQTTRTISVVVYGSTTPEPDEGFFVNLSGQSDNAALDFDQGYGSIWNDD